MIDLWLLSAELIKVYRQMIGRWLVDTEYS